MRITPDELATLNKLTKRLQRDADASRGDIGMLALVRLMTTAKRQPARWLREQIEAMEEGARVESVGNSRMTPGGGTRGEVRAASLAGEVRDTGQDTTTEERR